MSNTKDKDAAILCGVNVGMENLTTPKYEVGPDHTKEPCDACGLDLWLGPKQKAARIAYNLGAICMLCLRKQARKEGCLDELPKISKTMDGFSHRDFNEKASDRTRAVTHFKLASASPDILPFFANGKNSR